MDYVRVKADLSQVAEASEVLAELIHTKAIAGGDVEPSSEDRQHQISSTRKAVLNASSLDNAVREFVRKMEIPEGMSGVEVAETTRQYLQRGQKKVADDT